MTNVITEIATRKPSALAKSIKVSDVVSVGSPAQTNTMELVAPIINENINRVLLELYFIVSHENVANCGVNQPLVENILPPYIASVGIELGGGKGHVVHDLTVQSTDFSICALTRLSEINLAVL